MENKTKAKIRRLAYRVRKTFEAISEKECGEKSLGGYCARASAVLSELLTENNIPHRLAYGSNHVYIEWEGYKVDTTATQFSKKFGKVTIRKTFKPKWWKTSAVFESTAELKKFTRDWPFEQKVKAKDKRILNGRKTKHISKSKVPHSSL